GVALHAAQHVEGVLAGDDRDHEEQHDGAARHRHHLLAAARAAVLDVRALTDTTELHRAFSSTRRGARVLAGGAAVDRTQPPKRSSSACAAAIVRWSLPRAAAICTATGSPWGSKPVGTTVTGSSSTLKT